MDSLHAIGFYVSSGVLLVGGLGVALLPGRDLRGISLAAVGVGLAGAYVSLTAGFAAAVALLCYAGCAVMVAGPGYRTVEAVVTPLWRQLGALGAAALLGVLAFSAYRSDFVQHRFSGGPFEARAIGRLLLAHDVLATEAVAALAFAAAAGATAVWRLRDRAR
jgi:hypothetical protein